jgi:hypothetical protein
MEGALDEKKKDMVADSAFDIAEKSRRKEERKIRKERKKERKQERCRDELESFRLECKQRHEIEMTRIRHEHETATEARREQDRKDRRADDRNFGMQMISAFMPLVQSIGSGILKIQENNIKAQAKRLDVEAQIAEKSADYAKERVRFQAAVGKLFFE